MEQLDIHTKQNKMNKENKTQNFYYTSYQIQKLTWNEKIDLMGNWEIQKCTRH